MRTYKTPIGELPSVTEILSILDKPGLNYWYASNGLEKSKKMLNAAAERGTLVHAYAQAAYAGKKMTVPERLNGYVSSFEKFKGLFPMEQAAAELMVWSRHGYAGTFDFLGHSAYAMYLVDYKTSPRIYFQNVLQLCFYAQAAREQGVVQGKIPLIPLVVRLKEDGGTPQVLEVKNWQSLFDDVCLSVLSVFNALRKWRSLCETMELEPKWNRKKASRASKTESSSASRIIAETSCALSANVLPPGSE